MNPRISRPACLPILAMLWSACSDPPNPSENCSTPVLPQLEQPLEVSEGGRLVIGLGLDPEAFLVELVGLPENWRGTIDPEGTQVVVRLPYGIDGQFAFRIRASCGEDTVQSEVEVDVRRLSLVQIATWTGDNVDGPDAREHPAMWFDHTDPDSLFLFGGLGFDPQQYTIEWDLWQLDLTSHRWQQINTNSEPPHLASGRLAVVPGTRQVLWHGGFDGLHEIHTSVWSLDLASSSWQEMDTGTGIAPQGPVLHSFVYDPLRDRYINACGLSRDGSFHCDVHAYDANQTTYRWSQLETVGGPPQGRIGFVHAYDAEADRLILFSGDLGATRAQDTWALELSEQPARWVKLLDWATPAVGRRNAAFAFDPQGNRIFVWGGTANGQAALPDLYVLELDRGFENVQKVELDGIPPERCSGTAVYDPVGNRIVLGFGNSDVANYADLWMLQL